MRCVHLLSVAILLHVNFLVETAAAGELLDGRAFSGMIGPAENPDLQDTLYFEDGQFWSDICTRCGFVPGRYTAAKTSEGIVFSGVLSSDSRGTFDYRGVVAKNGSIHVVIKWERRRWYWTSRREIVFEGTAEDSGEVASVEAVRALMDYLEPSANPQCARF